MKDKIAALAEGRETAEIAALFRREIVSVARSSGLEFWLRKKLKDDYVEEIYADLRLKVLLMKEELLRKERITRAYVRKMIRSCILDALNRQKINTVSVELLVSKDEEGGVRNFEDSFGEEERVDLEIEARDMFDIVLENISEKDIEVLCYELHRNLYSREIELKTISKTVLYKRWERLKEKMSRWIPYTPSPEELRAFAERFLSEVCDKRGYK